MKSRRDRILRHLAEDYTEPIRDPLWNHIYLSAPLEGIIASPHFQRLGRIKQLGPAFLLYPGATHTRLSHSYGVFHLAKQTILALLRHDGVGDFSLEGVKSFLTAALLHDLGHFPFAHSLKELSLRNHEALAAEIILDSDITPLIRDALKADPEMVASIVDLNLPNPEKGEVAVFRHILLGVLDPDKLDYLNRDAFFCGVSYGTQDADYIVSKLVYEPDVGMALDEAGLLAVENVLFSKYLMYRTVYWHKTVRSATAMIKKALFIGLEVGRVEPEEIYELDDEQFFQRLTQDRHQSFSLIEGIPQKRLHKLIWEEPVRENDPQHLKLLDLKYRRTAEKSIAAALQARVGRDIPEEAVIIDIPEPISFEVDLWIRKREELIQFTDTDTVFGGAVVEGFANALRKLRIFIDPRIELPLDVADPPLTWIP